MKRSRHKPAGKDRPMVTAKGAMKIENQFHESISKEFFESGGKKSSPDDEAYYKAFAAVLELRIYLQGKEKHEM